MLQNVLQTLHLSYIHLYMCVYSNSTPISIEKYILEIISINKLEIEKNVNLSFFSVHL